MADTKKRLKVEIEAENEALKAELERLKEENRIDIAKGSGYIDLFVQTTEKSMVRIRYPLIALLSMGINDEAKVKAAIDAIDTANQELYFPSPNNRILANDKKGVSNLPTILGGKRKIIGKKVRLLLPKEVQRGESRGRKQKRAIARIPTYVPLTGFAILQAWLNSTTASEDNWVKSFYGPSGNQLYKVPAHNDTEEMKAAALALAKDEEVAPTGTQDQGQGN